MVCLASSTGQTHQAILPKSGGFLLYQPILSQQIHISLLPLSHHQYHTQEIHNLNIHSPSSTNLHHSNAPIHPSHHPPHHPDYYYSPRPPPPLCVQPTQAQTHRGSQTPAPPPGGPRPAAHAPPERHSRWKESGHSRQRSAAWAGWRWWCRWRGWGWAAWCLDR